MTGARSARLAPRDAQLYWISRRLPTDLHLLYCFADAGQPPVTVRHNLIQRAQRIPELSTRVAEVRGNLDYPYWVPAPHAAATAVTTGPSGLSWPGFLDELGQLLAQRLDAQEQPWKLHLFHGVTAAPGGPGPGTVALLRMAHALADGQRAAQLARALFAGVDPVDTPASAAPPPAARALWGAARMPAQFAQTVIRGVRAARVYQRGNHPAPPGTAGGQPLTMLNADPGPDRAARMIVLPRSGIQLPGYTVTVSALTAISVALSRYLRDRGAPPARLGAEITLALPPQANGRNNFRNAGIDLCISEPDLSRRAALIAAQVQARRAATASPLARAQSAVTAVLPARILAAEVAHYSLDQPPRTVSGNTVVSSVNRGPGGLRLGGGIVRFTAGFPALSPAMGLTHGVHGIGDTITLSVHASPALLPDIDRYTGLLASAIAQLTGREWLASPEHA